MASFESDEAVGSLLDGDLEGDGFGEPIASVKDRRMGVARARSEDDDAPSSTSFDRTFDQAYRSRRSSTRGSRSLHQRPPSRDDRGSTDRTNEVYRQLSERRVRAPRRRIILDGAEDDPLYDGGDVGRDRHEHEDADVDDDGTDFGIERDDPPPRERSRAELVEHLAQLEAQLTRLSATTSPARAGQPSRPSPPPNTQPEPTSAAEQALDVVTDLSTLADTLGLSEPSDWLLEALDLGSNSGDDLAFNEDAMQQDTDEAHEYSDTRERGSDGRAYIPAAQTDDHCSPMCIARALFRTWGDTDLDPCASKNPFAYIEAATQWFGPREDDVDGLNMPWFGLTYVNPPYGREIKDWIDKIILETDTGAVRGAIALLPIRSDVPWFHDDVLRGATAVCFIKGRLKFGGSKNSAPFPSIVVLWGDEFFDSFKQAFEVDIDPDRDRPLGTVVDLRSAEGRQRAIELATRIAIADALEARWEGATLGPEREAILATLREPADVALASVLEELSAGPVRKTGS